MKLGKPKLRQKSKHFHESIQSKENVSTRYEKTIQFNIWKTIQERFPVHNKRYDAGQQNSWNIIKGEECKYWEHIHHENNGIHVAEKVCQYMS